MHSNKRKKRKVEESGLRKREMRVERSMEGEPRGR
jgi:hypothetical protein